MAAKTGEWEYEETGQLDAPQLADAAAQHFFKHPSLEMSKILIIVLH